MIRYDLLMKCTINLIISGIQRYFDGLEVLAYQIRIGHR